MILEAVAVLPVRAIPPSGTGPKIQRRAASGEGTGPRQAGTG